MIFNIVFFVSVTSVLIQGTTLTAVAKWLHVGLPEKVKPQSPTDAFLAEMPKAIMKEIRLSDTCTAVGKKIVELNFPKSAIIAMIQREGKYITPNGATELETEDVLIVLSDTQEGISKVFDIFQPEAGSN